MQSPLLTERIEACARTSPAAIAVVDADGCLNYGELIQQADRVASFLLAEGVRPGDLVGVSLDRSAALITATLGVLRAGCAYLPLDPEYPSARLRFMLEDSGATALVARPEVLTGLAVGGVTHIDLAAALRTPAAGTALPDIAAHDLAYVIYTSGSTGRPKGVGIEHGNVGRLFDTVREHIPFDERDVWSWFHSSSFDFSVWEIWGALASGARVVVVSVTDARDPAAFFRILCDHGVTMLSQTPSAFLRLLPMLRADRQSCAVSTVVLGGEAVSIAAFDEILSGATDGWPAVYNLYGITETTVHATVKELTRLDLLAGVRSPIGVPLSDLQFTVLDADQRPVPAGSEGELWIAGAGVARGYMGRPELTAERFVAGVLPGSPQARWYRTGDLVRQLDSGEFEYIGRADRQVKLRGFRIELGEIEAALVAHPGLSAAAVEMLEDSAQPGSQLTAFLVTAGPDDLTSDEIRQWLAGRLPDYMIPTSFVLLDAIPLTHNGKVDRAALRTAVGTPVRRHAQIVAPRTAAEQKLQSLWADVLGSPAVSRDDNFFGTGGDSLLALRLVAACKAEGMKVTMRDLFQHPTLAGLATLVAAGNGAAEPGQASLPASASPVMPEYPVPAGAGHLEALIPASRMQCGVLFESELYADAGTYHVVSATQLSGLPGVSRPDVVAALEQVTAQNAALRTGFDLAGFDVPMQLVHRRLDVRLDYADLTTRTGEQRDERISEIFETEQANSFDQGDFPLWRVWCLKTSADTLYVMLTHHHAILDGWSVATFFDMLGAALTGRPYVTAPRRINEEAARLETAALSSGADERFWRAQARAWMPLPATRGAACSPASARAVIDGGFRGRIAVAAAAWGCAPKHIYLAAHLRALAKFAQWDDYAATTLVLNTRPEEADAHRALGMFLNIVPVAVGGLGSSWEQLARTAMTIEARVQPHRWFPLATMVERFAMPAPNVWFNYTDFSTTPMRGFLARVNEVSPTSMPLTVSVLDDGLVIDAMGEHFPAAHAKELLDLHMSHLHDALAEAGVK